MTLLDTSSLATTLSNLTLATLKHERIPAADRSAVAAWIAGRLNQPGSYGGLPAPTAKDYGAPFHLFTGETVRSGAATGCKLGFEATWALSALSSPAAAVSQAAQASQATTLRLFSHKAVRKPGMYCCYSCSVAGWRALATGQIRGGDVWLHRGVALLKQSRDGKGRWRSWPFWYTTLALSQMELPAAKSELKYVAAILERAAARNAKDLYARRRILLAQCVLEALASMH